MESAKTKEVIVRKAYESDIHAIQDCLEPFVVQGKILARSLDELKELIEQYYVAEVDGEVVGCAVLEIYSKKLCEIRSLAVKASAQGCGAGKKLVLACVQKAREEKILEVMAITSRDEFFQSCGFDYTLPGEKKALFMLPGLT